MTTQSRKNLLSVGSKNMQNTAIVFIVILVVVTGGLLVTRRASLFPGDSKGSISQDFPGLKAEDISSFISARQAYEQAESKATTWQQDAVFNYLESQGLTWQGTSLEWDVVFSSLKAKKTLHVVIGKSGITRQYEGVGKDSSGYEQNLQDIIIDSPNVLSLLVSDEKVSRYIQQQLGVVNPLYTLMEREEVSEQPILGVSKAELFWRVIFKPQSKQVKALKVWVDGQNGAIVFTGEEANT